MDEPEWLCDLCGLAYDTEAQVLECAWHDQASGRGADPAWERMSRMAPAA